MEAAGTEPRILACPSCLKLYAHVGSYSNRECVDDDAGKGCGLVWHCPPLMVAGGIPANVSAYMEVLATCGRITLRRIFLDKTTGRVAVEFEPAVEAPLLPSLEDRIVHALFEAGVDGLSDAKLSSVVWCEALDNDFVATMDRVTTDLVRRGMIRERTIYASAAGQAGAGAAIDVLTLSHREWARRIYAEAVRCANTVGACPPEFGIERLLAGTEA